MRDGVVTSVLSRLDKLEIFFGKMFVMLLMLFGICSDEDPTLGVDGKILGRLKLTRMFVCFKGGPPKEDLCT